MRLRQLQVEHYGVFSEQQFDFGDDGFHVIFGPNEAGKSTLLQLIREVLFGFPNRTPFAFSDHRGEMAATATVQLADGTRVTYRRRKGRKRQVVGRSEPGGHEIDAAALSRLFGGASIDLYEQVFGFSLRELASGEQGLQQANLNEALYGGGLGGLANFQQVVGDLQDEADGLFTPRSSTRTINRLLKRIKTTEADQRKAMVKPGEYKRQREAAAELGERVAQLARERDRLLARATHLERVTKALPCWHQILADRDELANLAVPPDFPAEGSRRLAELKQGYDERTLELEELEQESGRRSQELAALQLAPEILADEAAIRRLSQQVSQMASFREDIPKRQQEAQDQRAGVRRQLRELNPAWEETQLDAFASSLEQRDAIERRREERDRLDRRKTELTAGLSSLSRDIQRLEEQQQSLQIDQVPGDVADLVDAEASYRSDRKLYEELTGQLEELQAEIGLRARKLSGPLGTELPSAELLPVPMEQTILEYRDRLAAAREAVRQATDELQRATRERTGLRERLRQLEAHEPVPDRTQMQAIRERRDAGWKIIRRKYVEAEAVAQEEIDRWADAGSASLVDQYERVVAEADHLADERQAKATSVAQREQLLVDVQQLDRRVEALEQQLTESCRLEAERNEAWNELWQPCGLTPLSPDAMLDWRRDYEVLVERQHRQTKLARQRDDLAPRVEQIHARLRAVFGPSTESIDRLFKCGRETIARERDLRTQRVTLAEQLRDKRHDLTQLDRSRDQLAAEEADHQKRWAETLERFRFPATWDVHLATRILDGLTAARGQYERALSLEERVQEMQQRLSGFASQVEQRCRSLAEDLLELPPESAALQLHERLDTARQAARDQLQLQRDLTRLAETIAHRRSQRQEISDRLADLLAQAEVSSEEAFLQIAARAERQEQLVRTIHDTERDLREYRSTEDPAEFQSALETADADAIAAEQRGLQEQIQNVQRQYDDLLRQKHLADQALADLETESRASGLAMDLESSRSELATTMDRWAPLMLAQLLMKRAIDRFEREHQPAMLGQVQRLFKQLTLGRYVSIERKLDERGTLVAVTAEGQKKEPAALSTGTREQLYLAIRLAYILHYCRDAEPLPIVMDDVLVNFDDQRAVQTLEVLQQITPDVQVLFLTCHQHLVDLVQKMRPDMPVTTLSTDG